MVVSSFFHFILSCFLKLFFGNLFSINQAKYELVEFLKKDSGRDTKCKYYNYIYNNVLDVVWTSYSAVELPSKELNEESVDKVELKGDCSHELKEGISNLDLHSKKETAEYEICCNKGL